jgi:hypothetical protein
MYTYQDVLAKFNSRNKDLQVDEDDIIDWCSEIVQSVGNLDYMTFFKGVEIKVNKNRIAMLPCNFYKLDYLFINGCAMNSSDFRVRSRKSISFTKNIECVTIDYYGIPLDDEGYPELANDDVVEACYWYCLEMLMMDDWLTSKLSETKYEIIKNNKKESMTEASSSLRSWTKNRQSDFNRVLLNMHPKLRVPRQ